MDVLISFFSHPNVGLTIGFVVASGMVIGCGMVYLRMTRKQVIAWMIAFFVLLIFVETIRFEVFVEHQEAYSILPFLTIAVPFCFYATGMGIGAHIARRYSTPSDELYEKLLRDYECTYASEIEEKEK